MGLEVGDSSYPSLRVLVALIHCDSVVQWLYQLAGGLVWFLVNQTLPLVRPNAASNSDQSLFSAAGCWWARHITNCPCLVLQSMTVRNPPKQLRFRPINITYC